MTRIQDNNGADPNGGPPGLVSWQDSEVFNEGPPGLVSWDGREDSNGGGPPGLVSAEDSEDSNSGPPGLVSSQGGEDSTGDVPDLISLSGSSDDEMSMEGGGGDDEAEQTREQQMRDILPELVSDTPLVAYRSAEYMLERFIQGYNPTAEFQVLFSDSDSVFVVANPHQ